MFDLYDNPATRANAAKAFTRKAMSLTWEDAVSILAGKLEGERELAAFTIVLRAELPVDATIWALVGEWHGDETIESIRNEWNESD